MTAMTFLRTRPLFWHWDRKADATRPKGYKGRRRHATRHEGASLKSPLYCELMPAEGVLREDVHEDITDLELAADKVRAEMAERGNDTRDDVLGGIDPEVHFANEPVFAQLFAEFDETFNALLDQFTNHPQAPRRVLAAADMTQEIDMSAVRRELVAAAAAGLAA